MVRIVGVVSFGRVMACQRLGQSHGLVAGQGTVTVTIVTGGAGGSFQVHSVRLGCHFAPAL